MHLKNEIHRKAIALQAQHKSLAYHWHAHPLSQFEYKWLAIAAMGFGTAMLARNRTFRRLYLAYNLIRKPPFSKC